MTLTTENAINYLYHDIDPATASGLVSLIRHQSFGVFRSKTTYAAWKHLPVTFLKCTADRALPLQAQESMYKVAEDYWTSKERPAMFQIEELATSHTPWGSKVDDVVAIVKRAAAHRG